MRRIKKEPGEIKKVSDLFEKYKKTLIAPEKTVIKVFCEVVDDLLGVTVAASSVRYSPSTKVISLSQNGPLKTEIKLHQAEIIAHLKGRLGERQAPKSIL